MWRCIKYKHNSSLIVQFSFIVVLFRMLSWGMEVKLSSAVYLAPNPHLPGYQSIFFANYTYYKPSEYEDVSIINIIQV